MRLQRLVRVYTCQNVELLEISCRGLIILNNSEIWRILDQLEWSDLDVDQEGLITVNEVGRWCRQQHIDVSNFLLLRLVSEDCVRK